jgi:hypothetical protein
MQHTFSANSRYRRVNRSLEGDVERWQVAFGFKCPIAEGEQEIPLKEQLHMAKVHTTKPAGTASAPVTTPQKGVVDANKERKLSQQVTPVNRELQWLRANHKDFDNQLGEFALLNDEEFGKLQQPIADEGTKLTDNVLLAIAAKRKFFNEHIAMFWEVKQRLTLAARWRSDLAGNQNRTAETNKLNFGAADWNEYCEKYVAYSLSAADKKLVAFEQTINAEAGKEDAKTGSGKAKTSPNGPHSNPANIEALGIKLARDLIRITTVPDPAVAVRALQELVKEAERLLSLLGKPPDVSGKSVGKSPKREKGVSKTTSSGLAKAKSAAKTDAGKERL